LGRAEVLMGIEYIRSAQWADCMHEKKALMCIELSRSAEWTDCMDGKRELIDMESSRSGCWTDCYEEMRVRESKDRLVVHYLASVSLDLKQC
jgi:hypothetical protein